MTANDILGNTMREMFARNDNLLRKGNNLRGSKEGRLSRRDLELALVVMLVDLASCDQHFEQQEYHILANGLRRIFGTNIAEVRALVNQANTLLANFRGTSRFAAQLKENLNEEQRTAVMEVIEEVISADGVEDGYETYLRHKFADLLGIQLKEAEQKTDAAKSAA